MKFSGFIETDDYVIGNPKQVYSYLKNIFENALCDNEEDHIECCKLMNKVGMLIFNEEVNDEDAIKIDKNNGMGTTLEIWKQDGKVKSLTL